jgi:hypothetical protein
LIAEDRAAAIAVISLVDRAIRECQIEWLRELWDPPAHTDQRAWRPLPGDRGEAIATPAEKYTKKAHLEAVLGPRRLRSYALGVGGRAAEVAKGIAAIEYTNAHSDSAVAVLAFDLDRERIAEVYAEFESRRERFERGKHGCCLLLAVAKPEFEAWYIAGFMPQDEAEKARLAACENEYGFCPTAHPHRLTSASSSAERDAKKTLRRLTGGNGDREAECLQHPEFFTRGSETGIAEFYSQLIARMISALSGAPNKA